jgi:putative ABC transport system ATP-binding protein
MTDAQLVATGLTVTYPDGDSRRTILDSIDLTVAAGETVAVSGASGSGKSTLLAVCGLLRTADSGDVAIAGTSTAALPRRARTNLRRDKIAFVFQGSNLFPSLKAREQLELVAHIRGELDRTTRARARELLDLVGLAPHSERLPGRLSGGERQRVCIARALMGKPSVLLLY